MRDEGEKLVTAEEKCEIRAFESSDPLRRLLTGPLHLNPVSFGLLILIADILVDGWIGFHYNVFWSTSDTPGLLQDYGALVVDFVSNPVICGLYLWTVVGTTTLFRQLFESGVFKSQSEFKVIVDHYRSLYRGGQVFWLGLAASLIFALSEIAAYLRWVPWQTAGGYLDLAPQASIARAPFWFLSFYAMICGLFNVGMTIIVLRKLFENRDIEILPLHPDHCGGIGSISQYALKVGYAIGTIGLVLSGVTLFQLQHRTLVEAFPVLLGIIAYIVLAPVFFFWPLGTAHDAMQRAKDAELLSLAKEFDSVYREVKVDLRGGEGRREHCVNELEQVKRLYQMVEQFPVWPFDTGSLRRFFAIVTAPLLPALVSILSGLVSTAVLH